MKILTGSLKGKTLSFKPNPYLRPTSDKVRKAIFDMLQGQVRDKRVLDLYSGTGALGFEALSCGAAQAVFVEKDKKQCDKIEGGLVQLGLAGRGQVLCLDAVRAVGIFADQGDYFDIVFLDPPYQSGEGLKCLETLAKSSLLHTETLIFLECLRREKPPNRQGKLRRVKDKLYGDTRILVYRPCDTAQSASD